MLILPKSAPVLSTVLNTNANSTQVPVLGASGSYGTWGQVIASTPNEIVLEAIQAGWVYSIGAALALTDANWIVEVGVGAAASEVPIGAISDGVFVQFTHVAGASLAMGGQDTYPITPVRVPAGSRLAVRGAGLSATATPLINIYLMGREPVDGSVPLANVYDVAGLFNGRSGVANTFEPNGTLTNVTSGTAFANGTSVEVSPSGGMPTNAMIIGLAFGSSGFNAVHTQGDIGIGPDSSNIVWWETFGIVGRIGLPSPFPGRVRFGRLIPVKAGDKVWLRTRANAVRTVGFALNYGKLL